jgi:O-antigen/teichoic acid export membrane protein
MIFNRGGEPSSTFWRVHFGHIQQREILPAKTVQPNEAASLSRCYNAVGSEFSVAAMPSADKQSKPLQSKNLLVNYVSLLGGTVLAKGLGLVTVLLLTRVLGVEDFGRYSLAFAYWALLNTLVDLGGSHIVGREIAKTPEQPRTAMESMIYLRLIGSVLFLPVGVMLGQLLGLSNPLIIATYAGLFAGFEACYDLYFSASMQLDKAAKARFIASIANVLLIGAAVVLRLNLFWIVTIAMLNPLVKLVLDYRYSPFKLALHAPDWQSIKAIFLDGWPLWLAGIQYLILTRVDTMLLQVLSPTGQHDLGIYSAAFRVSEVMVLFVNSLCPALLPLLVQRSQEHERIRFISRTGIRILMTVLMAMSLLIFWYAPWIAHMYGPGYAESADCIRILIWSQAFVAVNAVCYYLLLVYNVQGKRPVIIANVLMMLLNVGLNWLLIPLLKAEGASWATVITECALLVMMVGFVRLYTPLRLGRDILLVEGLALASSLLAMQFGLWSGIVSAALFVGMIFGLGLLKPSQIKALALERIGATSEMKARSVLGKVQD